MTHARIAMLFCLLGTPALAGDITVEDAYARAASPIARSGAAYMVLRNSGAADDRLMAVHSDVAEVAQLHTHLEEGGGVMRMRPAPDGFAVPAGGTHALRRGGDHIMLMGLTEAMEDGSTIPLTLSFERAGDITVEIPVDLERQDAE